MTEAWREYIEEQRAITEKMKRRGEDDEEVTTLRALSELLVRSEASVSP